MANNDRIDDQAANAKLPKPEVKIIVNGQSVFKPGMKTFFIDNDGDPATDIRGSEGKVVGGTVCACNAVCTCDSQCSCESYTTCTCDSQCSCESYTTCTCDYQCSCQSYSTGGCSCNQVCTCVPVH